MIPSSSISTTFSTSSSIIFVSRGVLRRQLSTGVLVTRRQQGADVETTHRCVHLQQRVWILLLLLLLLILLLAEREVLSGDGRVRGHRAPDQSVVVLGPHGQV